MSNRGGKQHGKDERPPGSRSKRAGRAPAKQGRQGPQSPRGTGAYLHQRALANAITNASQQLKSARMRYAASGSPADLAEVHTWEQALIDAQAAAKVP